MAARPRKKHLVDVWVYQADIIVASYTIAEGAEALVYALDDHLIWQAVAHMQQLCTWQIVVASSEQGLSEATGRRTGSVTPHPDLWSS